MENEIEITDELIAKYFAGGATPEEAMALDDWLQDPVNRSHFTALQKVWHASFPAKSPRAVNLQQAWQTINRKTETGSLGRTVPFYKKSVFKIAASIVLALTVGAMFYLNVYEVVPVSNLTIVTQDSLRLISFADSSTATLNRNSVLVYPEIFSDANREVTLRKGEAFFSITPDADKPFIIRTPIASVKVLGTTFNVVSTAETLEVSVDHGKVLVYTPYDSMYLTAGKAVTFNAVNAPAKTYKANSNAWAYATHKMVFNNTPLREVFGYVEKAQQCEINVNNTGIENCKLTATFEQVSTDYMLNLIAEALNLSVTKNDDHTFTVEGEGCH